MTRPLVVANASAFWGDQPDAAARLVALQPDLDFLTLDYLAEVSLSIMAIQRANDPAAGYARDFIQTIQSLAPFWLAGGRTRVVTNAGGLDPAACGRACTEVLRAARLSRLQVAVITGDDVLPHLRAAAGCHSLDDRRFAPMPAEGPLAGCHLLNDKGPPSATGGGRPTGCHLIDDKSDFTNLETGAPLADVADRLVTANAYVGAVAIAAALRAGADIVITGRVADPSLTVGPCMAHFGWDASKYDRIAGATVAGHLIECGTQACGGFSTDWLSVPHPEDMGFPIVEIDADGSCIVTKPADSGGTVTVPTVKEQLLYEVGDPGNHLSPDATVSFLSLRLDQVGPNRVRVSGARGRPPPPNYKVSATYRDGYKAHGMLTVFGHDAVKKARHAGEAILGRLRAAGFVYRETLIECLGTGASVRGIVSRMSDTHLVETVLRIGVAAETKEPVERFTREIASLVTSGPQGVTGYASGRPKVLPIFGYWPCLIDRRLVTTDLHFAEAPTRISS